MSACCILDGRRKKRGQKRVGGTEEDGGKERERERKEERGVSIVSRIHWCKGGTIKLFLKYSHITGRWYANIPVPGLCRPYLSPPNSESPLATVFPHRPDRSRRRGGLSRIPGFARGGMSAYRRDNDWQRGWLSSLTMDHDNSCHPIYIYIFLT